MKRAVAMLALGLSCSGCFNLMYHGDGPGADGVYVGTRADSLALAAAVTGELLPDPTVSVLVSPVFMLDWPFEVVADTVTLPYDIYKECTRK